VPDAGSIICRRCGTANVPGDQFCGSCGAFLEWEGQPTEQPASEAATPPVTSATLPVPPPPVPAPPAPTPSVPAPSAPAGTTPVTPIPDAAADAAAGLIRCPVCGIANPASRTFCQSCGTTLAQAARVVEPDAAAIAAAVERQASVPRTPTTPVPGAAPRAAAKAPSRGFPTWILVIGGLGILVGIGIVAASSLLSAPGPGSIATTAPRSAAASDAAASSPTASPTPGPVQLELTSAKASSVVGNKAKFAAAMAIDGDPKTCWQEGKATEKGQWIEVTFPAARLDAITLYNGYELSDDAYLANLRLKDITVSVNGGDPISIQLKDAQGPQRFELGAIAGATKIRITIVSTYASKKTAYPNSPFDDAALSEIVLEGLPQ
jgi:hypothetical protein